MTAIRTTIRQESLLRAVVRHGSRPRTMTELFGRAMCLSSSTPCKTFFSSFTCRNGNTCFARTCKTDRHDLIPRALVFLVGVRSHLFCDVMAYDLRPRSLLFSSHDFHHFRRRFGILKTMIDQWSSFATYHHGFLDCSSFWVIVRSTFFRGTGLRRRQHRVRPRGLFRYRGWHFRRWLPTPRFRGFQGIEREEGR